MGTDAVRSQVHFIRAVGSDPPEVLAAKTKSVYLATGFNDLIAPGDFAALKIHFGEAGNTGYVKPPWLAGLIWEVRQKTPHAFLTDSNTLYVGNRSNSIDHLPDSCHRARSDRARSGHQEHRHGLRLPGG
jgi:uncharacterized Fe-S center protein